jgi:hypothetical protein
MWVKYSLLGFLLILVALGVVTTPSASAQASSAFSFSLQGSSLTQCWYYAVGFTATEGEQFVVLWNETNFPPISMNFYIVPQTSLHSIWYCTDGPVALYFNDGAVASASWAAPPAGSYAVILVNYSYSSVSGTLSIAAVNATVSATSIGYGTVRPYQCLGPGCIGGT